MIVVWRPSEPSLEESHIEETTVEAEELEQIVLECQGVVKFLLSSENQNFCQNLSCFVICVKFVKYHIYLTCGARVR